MSRKLFLYFALVEFAAALALLTADWDAFGALALPDFEGLVFLTAIGVLGEALAANFSVSGNRATTSISFLPIFAAALLFPEPAGMLVAASITAASGVFLRRNELYKVGFNVAQAIVAVALGVWVYEALGGEQGLGESLHVLGFVGLALSFFVANQVLIGTALALIRGAPLLETLRKVVKLTSLLTDVGASPIALIIIVLYREFHVLGAALGVLPLLVIRHSYVAKLQLEEANESLLKVLIKAIETRDPYTSGHSIRVSTLATWICDELRLQGRQRKTIQTSALLHDIGKIDIQYSTIIAKPSSLTQEERAVIQSHATNGADLLRKMTSLREEIILSVRHHHERYDGSGYPEGLVGTDIPLAARIIMLCDSVDAMLSDRPYRKALSTSRVREELQRCSGSQFDPDLVAAVISGQLLERARDLTGVRPVVPIAFQESA